MFYGFFAPKFRKNLVLAVNFPSFPVTLARSLQQARRLPPHAPRFACLFTENINVEKKRAGLRRPFLLRNWRSLGNRLLPAGQVQVLVDRRVSRDCERLADQRAVERSAARNRDVRPRSIDAHICGAGAADGDAIAAGVAAEYLQVGRDLGWVLQAAAAVSELPGDVDYHRTAE